MEIVNKSEADIMKTYKTSEVASIIGIHPNTVRLYEQLELIPKPIRLANNYRVFTEFHIDQFRLARLAFEIEVLQNGLRTKMIQLVKLSANSNFSEALILIDEYLLQIQQERIHAEEAITIVEQILSCEPIENTTTRKRKEVSDYLNISVDSLRNWEMNGLLTIKRKENGYRIYTDEDIRQLKIIRSLRCANYSFNSILHLLNQLTTNPELDIKKTLDTPNPNSEIIAVYDKLLTSLTLAEHNAILIQQKLLDMKKKYL